MPVITTNPNNQGKILLDTSTGHFYGFSSPETLAYWQNTLKVPVAAPPT